jgi:ribulose-5-phosphate 4-epimerase/fuculose-1-phosphate aldolase
MQPAATKSVRDQVTPEEWQARVDLAAMYRLTALYKWDDLVFTHISMRVPGSEHHFLINPYGFLFDEITASSLVKIDIKGNVVMETPHFINPAGFTIHSAIHEAREDVACVMHTHTLYGVAVSAQKGGLLPISQQAVLALTMVGYHGYEGVALNEAEKPRLVADLGKRRALILHNHGLLTVGPTAADAFLAMYMLESACRAQILAQSGGTELIHVADPIVQGMRAQAATVMRGMGGGLVWPGLLRKLDRVAPSFRE